ncbi:MAG: ribosome maturation factor RimM [Syntrophales bacterium]|nr:ribosome maturation factor RimM [Syntrophales bacterium]
MNDLIEIGKIVKPIGLKGRLKVLSYCEPARGGGEALESVLVGKDIECVSSFNVRHIRVQRGSFFLQLEGVEDLETAGELVGQSVFIPPETLPDGEYYWRDIIGLDIITEEGKRLGKITAILPTGSNDVYICSDGEREVLVPAFADVVQRIDIEKGLMVVRLPEGL